MRSMNNESLESKVEYPGIRDVEFYEPDSDTAFRHLIQRFRDKGSEEIHEVVFTEYGLQCNCHEWNSRRCCRHVVHVFDRLSVRDEHGRIIGIQRFAEIIEL
jgi:hypothetical protein